MLNDGLNLDINIRDIENARLMLARYPERLRAAMYRANLNSSSVLTQRIKEKLSNDVLHVRTGNLRRNWSAKMPVISSDGNAWDGGAGSGRTEYARYHEFGFEGDVQVRAHTRRGSMAFGRPVKPFTANVSAHSRAVNYAGRPYARPALREVRLKVESIHADQVHKAWEESQ